MRGERTAAGGGRDKVGTCRRQVTENRGLENIPVWLKIRARHKLTTRIFGHFLPVTSNAGEGTVRASNQGRIKGARAADWLGLVGFP